MGCSRIFTTNFFDDDILALRQQSSEQTLFPVSNTLNELRRSKVWRSNGYFSITSSNNTIVFAEGGGDGTATIAVAEYASRTTLYTAIKTALESIGASTYTISTDATTLKTKFVSDGGGGTFEIRWPLSTMGDILGFDTSTDDTGSLSYLSDQLAIHEEEWIEMDFGVPDNPQAIALTGPRNGSIKITPSATIKIQGNDSLNWSSPQDSVTLTSDDSTIVSASTTGLFSTARRFARILVTDISNSQGFIELGAIFLGDMFSPTRGAIQFGFNNAGLDRSQVTISEGGQTFTDIRPKSESFNASWFGLTIAEKEILQEFWEDVGLSRPFFIQIDGTPAIASTVNFYTRYVKFNRPISFRAESPGNFSATTQFREEL